MWGKSRSLAQQHLLFDSVRGVGNYLQSQSTAAEGFDANTLTSFNSNGFTLGSNITINTNASTNVAWQWQAGQGTTSSNTNGTITSTVSVNASAGFSVVTYTGSGSNATVGHGLGVAPSVVIVKSRNPSTVGVATSSWQMFNASVGAGYSLGLNLTNAAIPASTWWNNTAPTSSVFSLGSDQAVNESGRTFVAYCWTPIAGYSAFGSYTGNGSNDGPFVFLGFRPRFLMIKVYSGTTGDWVIWDSARTTYNAQGYRLYPNSSIAEENFVGYDLDFLSNGFKIRGSYGTINNNSSSYYIYAAFAENPFKNALAK